MTLEDFDSLVEDASNMPRRFGFAPTTASLYDTDEERLEARRKQFNKLDTERVGFISLDQWIK